MLGLQNLGCGYRVGGSVRVTKLGLGLPIMVRIVEF